MLQVLKNFFSSEKGVFAYLAPLIIGTIFVFTDRVTEQEWMEFALYLAGIYVSGKTIQGSAKVLAEGKQASTSVEAAAIREGLTQLRTILGHNDAAADEALTDKFPEESEKPE